MDCGPNRNHESAQAMLTQKNPLNIISAFGLAVGGAFGLAGTFVTQPHLQALLWAIDGVGIVMAAALLTVKYARAGREVVAAGFLVFAVAEAVLMSGTAGGPAASASGFAAGTILWALALVLISIPEQFALPVRILGLISAVLFAIVGLRIFAGADLLPTSAPLPFYAYPFLVATFAGWIWTLLREAG